MANGNAKSIYWGVVLNSDKKTLDSGSKQDLEAFFKRSTGSLLSYNAFKFVATITHDKDVNEFGEPKTIHLHAFIEFAEKRTLTSVLKELSKLLNVNENQLSLDKTNSDYLLVQYLTHKNDLEKTQYDYSLIRTNNEQLLNERYFKIYKQPREMEISLFQCRTISELINEQGAKEANRYRGLFNQIKQDQRQGYDQLYRDYEYSLETINLLENFIKTMLGLCENLNEANKMRIDLDSLKAEYEKIQIDRR